MTTSLAIILILGLAANAIFKKIGLGLPSGEIILAIAVLSILVTAPLGSIAINGTAEKLLT